MPAGKKIATPEELYWAEAEGEIEDVNGVLKITTIRVNYNLKTTPDKFPEAREAFSSYLARRPAAQSVINCIELRDNLNLIEK